jgi:hypothetical protein
LFGTFANTANIQRKKERTDISKLRNCSVIYIPTIDLYLQCTATKTNKWKFVEKTFHKLSIYATFQFSSPTILLARTVWAAST